MKRCIQWSVAGAASLAGTLAIGQVNPVDINVLNQRMLDACPGLWEDIRDDIDTGAIDGDHWQGNTADRDAFIDFISSEMGAAAPGPEGLDAMADDLATVAAECATQRLGFLDGLIDKLPGDALAAIEAVSEHMQGAASALSQDGFLVGDIRITGRLDPAEGWLFLAGQSIGGTDSGADLEGDDYQALFELARGWAPNSGAEEFGNGDVVRLPDARGRVIAGLDNMGGTVAGRLTDSAASRLADGLGAETHQLAVSQIPSHSHGMGSSGNHSHSYTDVSTHSGSSIAYGSGRGDSSQTRVTASAGNHSHSIHSTGGNQAHPIVQPTIVFNVEMKYR